MPFHTKLGLLLSVLALTACAKVPSGGDDDENESDDTAPVTALPGDAGPSYVPPATTPYDAGPVISVTFDAGGYVPQPALPARDGGASGQSDGGGFDQIVGDAIQVITDLAGGDGGLLGP